ncbi:MAG TPA: hypothetical protein VEJ16_08460 [Alphaproteobacteria bacterium]|nr:hypothetical protein [Alphaproteobacteria bacterium]
MFGFSLPKLIVLAGILLIVWYGFKLIGRIQALRDAEAKRQARDARVRRRAGDGGAGVASDNARSEVEETVKCRVCGAYVPVRGVAKCGQPGCPFP